MRRSEAKRGVTINCDNQSVTRSIGLISSGFVRQMNGQGRGGPTDGRDGGRGERTGDAAGESARGAEPTSEMLSPKLRRLQQRDCLLSVLLARQRPKTPRRIQNGLLLPELRIAQEMHGSGGEREGPPQLVFRSLWWTRERERARAEKTACSSPH